ncbi:uncharacterized protein LOC126368454 isoform X2 [Pectinophora gossypiella]|uniref:uncharacterized protein LOC126368454 isoform X2 n=1 Tax=Pectinophora gossypiella TaxID=13191 RepID=UPI00214E3351|nr:uncharacterized protein LOC126368454 isoform X2 [Pectinophora gossypiella]
MKASMLYTIRLCMFIFTFYYSSGCWSSKPKSNPTTDLTSKVYISPHGDYYVKVGDNFSITCECPNKKESDLLTLIQWSEGMRKILINYTKKSFKHTLLIKQTHDNAKLFCEVESSTTTVISDTSVRFTIPGEVHIYTSYSNVNNLKAGDILLITCNSPNKRKSERLRLRQKSSSSDAILGSDDTNEIEYRLNITKADNNSIIFCELANNSVALVSSSNISIVIKNDKSKKLDTDKVDTSVLPLNKTDISHEDDNVSDKSEFIISMWFKDLSPKNTAALVLGVIAILLVIVGLIYSCFVCRKSSTNLLTKEEEPEYASPEYVVQYAQLNLAAPQSNKPVQNDTPYAEIIGVAKRK